MKKIIVLVIFLSVYVSNSYALNLSRVKTWAAEVLTFGDLNAEFDNILDHDIANADIAAAAAIVASKIDFTVSSAIGSTTPSTGKFTTLESTGNTIIGDAAADTLHHNTDTITYEGATADAFETTLAITDPTADRTVTFPDADMNFVTGLPIANGGTGTTGDGAIKAWINMNGTGTIAINDSYNVASITDNGGTGDYTITWDTDFSDTNYVVIVTAYTSAGTPAGISGSGVTKTAGSFRFVIATTGGSAAVDADNISVIAIGDQ